MTHILMTAPFPQPLLDKIKTVSPEIALEIAPMQFGPAWPENQITEAEVMYAIGGIPWPGQAPRLRWIQAHWAGVDHLVNHPVWASQIMLTNSSGVHAINMGQYVLAQLLAWAHRVPRWLHYQRLGEWPEKKGEKLMPDELRGRTLGILGYGSIGREVARLAKPFGLKILVTKQNARRLDDNEYTVPGTGDPRAELPDRIYPPEATRSMLAQCDYVVITLPLTTKTHHLFNEEVFKAMKPTAFLINVGRGRIIEESALIKALKKGWIAGAGLDVFEEEPLPSESPLWQMENVIISPHISGMTPAYDERAVDIFITNLQRYLAGERLLNLVDRERGY
jgi:phosphoglycerate dehydrogenase-like enzyme